MTCRHKKAPNLKCLGGRKNSDPDVAWGFRWNANMQQNPINISTSFNLLANNTSIVFLNQIHNQHDCLVEPKSYMFVNKKLIKQMYIYIYTVYSNKHQTHIIISLTSLTYFTYLSQGISKKMSSTLIFENEKTASQVIQVRPDRVATKLPSKNVSTEPRMLQKWAWLGGCLFCGATLMGGGVDDWKRILMICL